MRAIAGLLLAASLIASYLILSATLVGILYAPWQRRLRKMPKLPPKSERVLIEGNWYWPPMPLPTKKRKYSGGAKKRPKKPG
jgi:hypothetical protein